TPPKDWMEPATFYKTALGNDWYKDLALIQSEIVNLTFDFFKSKELKTVCLPATTGSVTSPMGLGSDSLPVKINLEGTETYLADSMQFHLEYMLRFLNNGVHYIMPTFRGESADARHLCQFYHSEAEIIGNLSDVINLVEEYIKYMCESLLENNRNLLLKFTENLNHIENLLLILHSSNHFPQITVKEAAVLLEDNPKYVNKSELGFITITNEGEAKLIEHFNGIVWLTHHDYKSVPFYQAKDKKTSTALNADLLF
ncbi:TPA: asparaginase, partial [Staphylococcus pseudintermedius]|nr:asparaginase [Staphylococcus pseudintermedius]